MSSSKSLREERGEGTSASAQSTVDSSSSGDSIMKRAAVKQLIERYYQQLTDGCGRPDCLNSNCASSSKFQALSSNQAAVEALRLVREKADLCEVTSRPYKVAKSSQDEGATTSSSQQHCVTSKLSECRPAEALPTSSSDSVHSEGSGQSPAATSRDPNVTPGSSSSAHSGVTPTPIQFISESSLVTLIEECKKVDNWSRLIRTIGSVFNNTESLIRSFLLTESAHVSKEDLRSMEVDMDKDTDDRERSGDSSEDSVEVDMEVAVRDSESRSPAEISPAHGSCRLKRDEVSVDIPSIGRAFNKLFSLPGSPFQNALTNALRCLARNVEMELRYYQAYERDPNYLNIFVIVFEILLIDNRGELEVATPHVLRAAGLLPLAAQAKLARIWAKFSKDKLKELLGFLHQVITLRILSTQWSSSFTFNDDEGVTGAAKIMKVLYYASILGGQLDPPDLLQREREANREMEESLLELLEGAVGHDKDKTPPREDSLGKELSVDHLDCRTPMITREDFVNDLVSDGIRMEKDYTNYKAEEGNKFSFLTHPFLLTTAMKNVGMYYDSRIRMVNERRASFLQSFFNGVPTMPYLRIRIRRDHIIDDALVNLEMIAVDNPQDLKKQLYVEFEGEQGIDEGGVSKEFFQLVVEEIFNPDIGMFRYDEETKTFWFNSMSFENDSQFTLIGIVLGLAIYNNVILDVHFPMVVYRKLMGKLGTFEDLKDSHPTLAKSLHHMLNYEGDIEETFMQTFCVSDTNVFGATISHNLKENGDKIPVTNENKKEFVDLYADYLLNKAVEKQFRAFKRGFQMVTDESPLKTFFQPSEVEQLVCGSKNFDFRALEDATEYDGGYSRESQVIRNFWEIVHDFSEEDKRKLLQFTTGSDRVPVGGLSKLKLVIARHGPDSDRLPTAHTCFNVLLLPDYSTKDKLSERLSKAINYAKGFGML